MKTVKDMTELEFTDHLREVIERLEKEASWATRINMGNGLNVVIYIESDYDEVNFYSNSHGLHFSVDTIINKYMRL